MCVEHCGEPCESQTWTLLDSEGNVVWTEDEQ